MPEFKGENETAALLRMHNVYRDREIAKTARKDLGSVSSSNGSSSSKRLFRGSGEMCQKIYQSENQAKIETSLALKALMKIKPSNTREYNLQKIPVKSNKTTGIKILSMGSSSRQSNRSDNQSPEIVARFKSQPHLKQNMAPNSRYRGGNKSVRK